MVRDDRDVLIALWKRPMRDTEKKGEEEVRQEGEMNAGMDSRNMSVSEQQHRQVHNFVSTTNCQINMLASTITHGLLFI